MDFAQLGAVLHRAAALLNDRPLSARSFTQHDFLAITPRDLLLGMAPSLGVQDFMEQERMEEQPHRLARRVEQVEEKVRLWWEKFANDVFPLLVPRRTMQHRHESPEVGDIVMVRYASKVGRSKFRLGRVIRLHPDKHAGRNSLLEEP